MAGTVLVVTQLAGGLAGFGSGVVVTKGGLVLTNLHVLEGAQAVYGLVHDPERPVPSAVDGGLDRLMFERQADLIPLTLVRGDPVVDLAVLRLERPARVAVLTLRDSPAPSGEAVIAIGHPEQSFWSATRGFISGLPSGLIQHDALTAKGSSGGPLLDLNGEVVGINTLVLGSAAGLSMARPAQSAARLLDGVARPLVLDRSTPEKAVLSCARARELADPTYSNCLHWGSAYDSFRALADLAMRGGIEFKTSDPRAAGGPKSRPRARVKAWLDDGDGRADVWARHFGPIVLAFALSDDAAACGRAFDDYVAYVQDGTRGGKPPRAGRQRDVRQPGITTPRRAEVRMDPDIDTADAQAPNTSDPLLTADAATLRKTLKMGVRVRETRQPSKDDAYVVIEGRRLDRTAYAYTVHMVRGPDGWREAFPRIFERDALLPQNVPRVLTLAWLPTMLAVALGGVQLAQAVHIDDDDGVNQDFAFERAWPALMAAMRADPKETLKAATALSRH